MARRFAAAVAVLALVGAVPAQAKATRAKDALVRLADMPDGWSVGVQAKKASHKCLDYSAVIAPGSASSAFASFRDGGDQVSHAAAVYATEAAASKAFRAAVARFDATCKSFSFKSDGRRIRWSIGRMKLTPRTAPTEFAAWRSTVDIDGVAGTESLVAYRQGSTTGIISLFGLLFVDDDLFRGLVDEAVGRG